MYTNPLNPEFERREVPAPVSMRYFELRGAAQNARLADAAAFPDAPAEKQARVWPGAEIVNPMFAATVTEVPTEAVQMPITDAEVIARQALDAVFGADYDSEKAA